MSEFIAHIGTDESGKGDFFGPLVIAGVLADEKSAQYFRELGIKDSKKLSDKKMLMLAAEIKKQRHILLLQFLMQNIMNYIQI